MSVKNTLFYERAVGTKETDPPLHVGAIKAALSLDLPAGIKWKLVKARRQIAKEGEGVNETRIELLNAHGTLDKEKNEYDFSDDGRKAFAEAFAELMESTFELEGGPVPIIMEKLEEKGSVPTTEQIDALDYLEAVGLITIS